MRCPECGQHNGRHRKTCSYQPQRRESVNEFFGVDGPSAKYRWGVAAEFAAIGNAPPEWRIVRWFATRKRAERYAIDRYHVYAIARHS
jgi:hypothetical protein